MPVRSGKVIQAAPGLVIYRFGAGLYYANATRFTEEVLAILEEADPQVEWFCLSGASIGDVDYSGAGAIRQVASEVKERGATFVICDWNPGSPISRSATAWRPRSAASIPSSRT